MAEGHSRLRRIAVEQAVWSGPIAGGLEQRGRSLVPGQDFGGDNQSALPAAQETQGLQGDPQAAPLGVHLPIYPCKGYSATVPVGDRNLTPKIGGVDEDNLMAFCPMGNRLRITATAEFSGYDRSYSPDDFRAMFSAARDLFPDGGDYDAPELWAGLRPMTPTTVPILGRARYANLMLNVGHGHIGWTMSCGSAKVVSDLIAARTPEIDLDGLLYQ